MKTIPVFSPPYLWPRRFQYALVAMALACVCGLGILALSHKQHGLHEVQSSLASASAELARYKQSATAECAAGLLPAPAENRTNAEITKSLCTTQCNVVFPGDVIPAALTARKITEYLGQQAVSKLACEKICQ